MEEAITPQQQCGQMYKRISQAHTEVEHYDPA